MRTVAALLLLCACSRGPAVPVNLQLWRVDGSWIDAGPARKARASIIAFRSDHEFVEFHCWLIEQPDTTLYISSSDPRVMIVGKWVQRGAEVEAKRRSIARSMPFRGPADPLCAEGPMTFRVSGNSVVGNAGANGSGTYSAVTRLVAPAFESWVKEARESRVTCGVD